ncbi:hypothetical protein [Kribbella deserti]|uniref:TPM domain-containing protein n=1 Tax=Kribbella deserti TaxID=1926257 RepID=A0ABV6QJQ5_9ACTN
MRRLFVLVLTLLTLGPVSPAAAAPAVAPEVLDAIAASWRKDPVYVYSSLQIPPAELARIRKAAKSLDLPVYVALLPSPSSPSRYRRELTTLLRGRVGGDGLFLVWHVDGGYWAGYHELVAPRGSQAEERFQDLRSDDKAARDITNDQPAPLIVRRIQQAKAALHGTALPPIPTEDLDIRPGRRGMSAQDMKDRSAYIGMGAGAVLSFFFWLLVFLRWGGTAPQPSPAARRGARNAAEVTEAGLGKQADAMINRAARALRKVEAQISRDKASAEILDRRDDAAPRLEAARALRKETGLEPAAAALVLARQALSGLTEGVVRPPCFFNPTHLAGTSMVVWSDVEVPACKVCGVAVEAGEEPLSLRVPQPAKLFGLGSGEAPYWSMESDNPFVTTGFGALSDDLAERVMNR